MDRFLTEGRTDQYYEAVFANLIGSNRMNMSIMKTGDTQWAEIDTQDDLREAEKMLRANTSGSGLDRSARAALIA
jgi:choline kinase